MVGLQRYKNEMIVILAIFFALITLMYKQTQHTKYLEEYRSVNDEIVILKEVSALKKIWADKGVLSRVKTLQKTLPQTKGKWVQKGKELTGTFKDLSPSELNKLLTKLLNTPVQIMHLQIKKQKENYSMEIKCKW